MGAKNYDRWEKLVAKEQLRRPGLSGSFSSQLSSFRSSFSSISSNSSFIIDVDNVILPPDNQEILWTEDDLSYSLEKRTGKKCYMVGARKLPIAWGDNPTYWKWKSFANSRFPEVAELVQVWWLDIRGKIRTRMLSPQTSYAAFLIFKLADSSNGLEVANAMIRFVEQESDKKAEKQAQIVHLKVPTADKIQGRIPVSRSDGWMEVELGNFYIEKGDKGEVEARLLETKCSKSGLIIQGIEFRPSYNKTSLILGKKTVGEKSRRGGKLFPFSRR